MNQHQSNESSEKGNDMHRYDDIISLSRPISVKHRPMSMDARAIQFASFAALSGYDDAIIETARTTDRRIDLTEDEKEALDEILFRIRDHLQNGTHSMYEEQGELSSLISVTYFVPDTKKTGGCYDTWTGIVRKFDEYPSRIVFEDGKIIAISDIIAIRWESTGKE